MCVEVLGLWQVGLSGAALPPACYELPVSSKHFPGWVRCSSLAQSAKCSLPGWAAGRRMTSMDRRLHLCHSHGGVPTAG